MKQIKKLFFVAAAVMFVNASFAQKDKTVMVGGAAMYPSKNIVENAYKEIKEFELTIKERKLQYHEFTEW